MDISADQDIGDSYIWVVHSAAVCIHNNSLAVDKMISQPSQLEFLTPARSVNVT